MLKEDKRYVCSYKRILVSPSHPFMNDCRQLCFAEQYLDEALVLLSTALWYRECSHRSPCDS